MQRIMAQTKNVFDGLCDVLLESIFERALWNPCVSRHQARDRVRLEAVCKRFQEVVRTMGCLEWDIDNGPQAEQNFIRYALGSGCKGNLKKMALNAEHSANLMGILPAVIPHVMDSLQEVYLSLWFSEKDAKRVDWEHVLVMLQECKRLEVLHIFLWESGWDDPAIILDCSKLPKPFPKLHNLSLFGFAVASTGFDSFLKTFPSLETLELHHLDDQNYNSSSVKQIVSWGDQISGLDSQGPTRLMVPKSLEIVVGLLGSDNSGVREKALKMLLHLSYNAIEVQKVIARVQGCLRKLVDFLDGQKESVQEIALVILDNLVVDAKQGMTIAALPGFLKQVVDLFGSESQGIRKRAAYMLGTLAGDTRVCSRVLVQQVPGVLQGLVCLLGDEGRDVPEAAMRALAQLADSHWSGELIVTIPGCLEKLASMLESEYELAQKRAAWLLQRLVASDHANALARVPGCLKGLVDLLNFSDDISLQAKTARALRGLAEDAQSRQRMGQVPGFWRGIVRLLDPRGAPFVGQREIYEDAVLVLAHVGVDAGVIEVIASRPRALQGIVDVLESENMVTREHAVRVLNRITDNMNFWVAMVSVPGVLQKLRDCIPIYEDVEGPVRAEVAKLFQKLQ